MKIERIPLSKAFRQAVLKAYDHTCQYCQKSTASVVDHIIPLAQGGPNLISNFIAACYHCNATKSCNLLDEEISTNLIQLATSKVQLVNQIYSQKYRITAEEYLERRQNRIPFTVQNSKQDIVYEKFFPIDRYWKIKDKDNLAIERINLLTKIIHEIPALDLKNSACSEYRYACDLDEWMLIGFRTLKYDLSLCTLYNNGQEYISHDAPLASLIRINYLHIPNLVCDWIEFANDFDNPAHAKMRCNPKTERYFSPMNN